MAERTQTELRAITRRLPPRRAIISPPQTIFEKEPDTVVQQQPVAQPGVLSSERITVSHRGLNAQQLAERWVQRKLRGQRIITEAQTPTLEEAAIYKEARKIYTKIRADPTIRRRLSEVAEIKGRAIELGFGQNIREYVSASKFFRERFAEQEKAKPKEEPKGEPVVIVREEPLKITVGPKTPPQTQTTKVVESPFFPSLLAPLLQKKDRFVKIQEEPAVDRTGQTFVKELGGFVTTGPQVQQGTVTVDPLTEAEQRRIQQAEYRGSVEQLKDIGLAGLKAYEGFAVEPLSKTKSIQKLGSILKAVSQEVGDEVENISVETPILRDVVEAKRIVDRLPPEEKITIGYGGNRRRVEAGTLQNMGLIEFSKSVVSGEVETFVTRAAKSYEQLAVRPLQKTLPGLKETGVAKAFGTEKSVAEGIGKGAALTSEIAPYFLPGVFTAETIARAGEAAIGGRFGGPTNLIEFTIENPIEVGIVGVAGVAKGVKFLKAADAQRVLKQGKLYTDPKYQRYLGDKSTSTQLSIQPDTKIDAKTLRELGLTRKEYANQLRTLRTGGPRETLQARVEVFKDTGKGKATEFIKVNGKYKQFTGTVKQTKKSLEYTINYDKGIKKVVKINQKTGEGIAEIYKGKKLVSRASINTQSGKSIVTKIESSKKQAKESFRKVKEPFERKLPKKPEFDIRKPAEFKIRETKPGEFATRAKRLEFQRKVAKGKAKATSIEVQLEAATRQKVRVTPELKTEITRAGTKQKITPQRIEFIKGTKQTKPSDVFRVEPSLKSKVSKVTELKQPRIKTKLDIVQKARIDIKIGPKFAEKPLKSTKTTKELLKEAARERAKQRAIDLKRIEKISKKQKQIARDFDDVVKEALKETSRETTKAGQKYKLLSRQKPVTKVTKETFKITKATAKKITPKFIPGISSTSKALSGLAIGSAAALSTLQKKLKTDTQTIQKKVQEATQIKDVIQEPAFSPAQDTGTTPTTDTIIDTIPTTTTRLITIPTTRPASPTITIPRITPPPTRPTLPPVTPVTPEEELIKPKIKEKKSIRLRKEPEYYIPEAKRNDKWVKLSPIGLTKTAAQGRGARAVDMTVAGRFRIRPVAKGTDKVVDNYFAYNKNKFRDYKIKQGKQIPLKNTWIEKKGKFRIDQESEKAGLTLSKLIKKQDWLGKKKKRKKPLF